MHLSPLPEEFPPCTCDKCQALCRRPCWPTPAEAARLIEAGHGPQLMLAWWERPHVQGGNVLVLCPAVPGHQGFYAPDPDDWRLYEEERSCLMQTADGLCGLHTAGLKPLEGRLASGCAPYQGVRVRRAIATLWDTPEGRQVVDRWRRRFARW
jgi:hypothetical protein